MEQLCDSATAIPDEKPAHSLGLEFGDVVVSNLFQLSGLNVGPANDFAVTRRIAKGDALDAWFKTTTARNGAVVFFDAAGSQVKRYNLTAAKPKSVELNAVLSGDNRLLTETFVFSYTKCELG
jgi:hypothetical protein